jgi:hypothetical protein
VCCSLNHPDIYSILLGFVGGLFSTLLMTLTEIPSWKRWGLRGVFEWHENQIIIIKSLKLSSDRIHFAGIFGLHFLNGGVGGIGFLIALWIFPNGISHIFASALLYGFFLWIVTLIPIHKPITGLSPWSHPLGRLPMLASLVGHIVYAAVLGYFFINTPF